MRLSFLFVIFISTATASAEVSQTPTCTRLFPFYEQEILITQPTLEALFNHQFQTRHMIGFYELETRELSNTSPMYALNDFEVIDDGEFIEIQSAGRYAQLLKKTGEKLLFIPNFRGSWVPGFDGVIYNSEGNPVANFSLKKSLTDWRQQLQTAIYKAREFSKGEFRWFSAFSRHHLGDGPFRTTPSVFGHLFRNVARAMDIFGVRTWNCSGKTCGFRKTRVVIDMPTVRHEFLDKQAHTDLRSAINENLDVVDSITLIFSDATIVLSSEFSTRLYDNDNL